MKKSITAVAVFALSASLAIAAPHEGKGKGGRRGRAGFNDRMAATLNLTDAQKQQVKDLRERFRTENEPLHNRMKQLHADFKAAKDANDMARLETLKGSFQSLREQMRAQRKAQNDQFRALLTSEQRAQLDELKEKRGNRRQQRREQRQQNQQ